MKKIAVMTSGGDSPGMNAAIRAVVRAAINGKIEAYGCKNGFHGLINKEFYPLKTEDVANCIQHGGTILHTSRCDKFYDVAVQKQSAEYLRDQGISGLVVIGGDGSFRGAAALAQYGYTKVIGIPATIDNDVIGTDYCLGFDTARNTALEAIDKIRDTAFSHHRNFMVEVMGREAGFLAVDVGIAGGAEFILIPEFPVTIDSITEAIIHKKRKKLTSIMVVAEANKAGRSFELSREIKQRTGADYRVCILGHTQRGGSPTVLDRIQGTTMGVMAVRALQDGHSNQMVAEQHGKLCLIDFPPTDAPANRFNRPELLQINNIVCK